MKKRVADIIVDTLIEHGITDCFSVVGGGAMHLNNAFVLKNNVIRTIYTHHEQACSMAAEGYARLSGKMAAVCVTSGPGGINAINGVQGAWVDSLPMIVISGHPRYETTVPYTGLRLRVRGVQENDIVRMVSGITKYAKTILDPKSIKFEVEKAISIAMDGRRGPVWIDVPLDIQSTLVEDDEIKSFNGDFAGDYRINHLSASQLDKLQEMIDDSIRPVVLTGSGIRTGDAESLYRNFMENMKVPIVGGAQQADINFNGEPYYYGMSGTIGPRAGNFILENADLIIVLANSLSYSQTGHEVSLFAPKAKFVMIDAEEDESKKSGLHVDLSIVCDIKEFFKEAVKYGIHGSASSEWFDYCKMVHESFPRFEMLDRHGEFQGNERIPALLFWDRFTRKVQPNAVINLGNSCGCHGVLQEGIDHPDQRILVNYKCGSMGDDITEAIGSAVADSTVPQYCVTGEGSLMMNLQEFQTIHHYKLPIKTVVFNNNGYGGIRKTCESFFDGLYNGCTPESGISFPDYKNVAETFKLPYRLCRDINELNDSIDWLINQKGNCLLEIYERIDEIRGPRLESRMDEEGHFFTPPLYDLSPLLDEDEIKKYILK